MYCRLAAAEFSALQPALAAAGCRLVGVGLEPLGLEEFVQGGYFTGELFVDMDKSSFKGLGYKRLSYLALIPAMLARVARDGLSKAKAKGISGDLKGDGLQNGGVLVVGQDGPKILLDYKQQNPADHPDSDLILQALGIEGQAGAVSSTEPVVQCTDDVCSIAK